MSIRQIVIVCFEDPRRVSGGVQRRVAAEIEYFSKCGIGVTVITEGLGGMRHEESAQFITIPTPAVIYPLRSLIFAARAGQLLRRLPQGEVIEAHHDAGGAVLFAFPFRGLDRSVFVEVVHGVFRDEFAAIRQHEKPFSRAGLVASGLLPLSVIEQAAAHRATAVVTVSQYSAGQIVRHYGVPRSRIHVISNGISAECYTPAVRPFSKNANGAVSLLYVGRLNARKGVIHLLQAFALARHSYPSLQLKFVGDGPLAPSLWERCVHLGLEGVVEFVGIVTDKEVLKAYQSADIVCIPSLQEGQGIVALEAQACGVPVVASRATGLLEVVRDRQTGLLVAPGDIEALSEAILELARNPILRQELGHNAARWALSFTWENMLSACLPLYEKLSVSALETQRSN